MATVSNRGLNVELALAPLPGDKSGTVFIAMLDCDVQRGVSLNALTPAIVLQKTSWHSDTEFVRIRPDYLLVLLMNRIILPEDGSLTRMGSVRLSEARPRQLFVPHSLSATRSPRGILFHPEVATLHPKDKLIVDVLSQPSEWLLHDERRPNRPTARALATGQNEEDSLEKRLAYLFSRAKSYVLNFDHSSDLGVSEPTQVMILGSMELEIKQLDGWNSWHVCLITGLEPLPPNPLGTPSLYTVPWYAFERKDKIVAGELDDVLVKERRQTEHNLMGWVLKVEFDLESRHSRLFYNVVLKLATPEKEERR